jgi:CO/xanthine dehydrogenase Mo-binding subunit
MRRCQEALGTPVEAYGKGGIVGEQGELEHVAAVLHPKFAVPTRGRVGPIRSTDEGDAAVLLGRGSYDPRTTPLDADGQGAPYETYAFGAQVALVEVDPELGTVEAYVPGRTENLHDYLVPTIGDAHEIECILVEDREPAGPYGAKGVGKAALVPTAPAILAAIQHATGARITQVPATPERLRAAVRALGGPNRSPA